MTITSVRTALRWTKVREYGWHVLWTNGVWKESFAYGIDPNTAYTPEGGAPRYEKPKELRRQYPHPVRVPSRKDSRNGGVSPSLLKSPSLSV